MEKKTISSCDANNSQDILNAIRNWSITHRVREEHIYLRDLNDNEELLTMRLQEQILSDGSRVYNILIGFEPA